MSGYKPQVGDRVRFTQEGVVESVNAFIFLEGNSRGIYSGDGVFELLERRKPKVGDVVEGKAAFRALPEGTVVVDEEGDEVVRVAMVKQRDGGWRSAAMLDPDPFFRRVILFIPED